MAFRLSRPELKSFFTSLGHFDAQTPQPTHLSSSTYRGRFITLTFRFPSSPWIPSTSAQVISRILRCCPHSTSFGLRMHIEQSFVGKVLSNWGIVPPMAGDLSTRYT